MKSRYEITTNNSAGRQKYSRNDGYTNGLLKMPCLLVIPMDRAVLR